MTQPTETTEEKVVREIQGPGAYLGRLEGETMDQRIAREAEIRGYGEITPAVLRHLLHLALAYIDELQPPPPPPTEQPWWVTHCWHCGVEHGQAHKPDCQMLVPAPEGGW